MKYLISKYLFNNFSSGLSCIAPANGGSSLQQCRCMSDMQPLTFSIKTKQINKIRKNNSNTSLTVNTTMYSKQVRVQGVGIGMVPGPQYLLARRFGIFLENEEKQKRKRKKLLKMPGRRAK